MSFTKNPESKQWFLEIRTSKKISASKLSKLISDELFKVDPYSSITIVGDVINIYKKYYTLPKGPRPYRVGEVLEINLKEGGE